MADQTDTADDTLDEALREKARIVELSSSDEDFEDFDDDPQRVDGVPFPGKQFTRQRPTPRPRTLPLWLESATINLFHDELETTTSTAQEEVTEQCLPLLTGADTLGLPLNSHGVPHLRRKEHANFLHSSLGQLPAPYQVIDASRPWLFYWAMAGLSTLGEDVTQYRERLMSTVRPLQNPAGGFGGGHGQLSHCACSYSTTLALAAVGGLEAIDRKAMWYWLGSIKQADGGFCMAVGAEEDIRGAYCAMTILTLLNLPLSLPPNAPARQSGLELFTDKLGEWVGRCQTYEGGVAGAPTNEAHGAYAFCALACLCILDAPHKSIPAYLDVPALIRWLSSMQSTPEGGFAGRTNKLVDACYSHWVGGCWALIQASLSSNSDQNHPPSTSAPPDLWNRAALIRYLLTCAQQPGKKGGMRDKPSCRPDGYHTCYSLAGLSAAQNHYQYSYGPTSGSEYGTSSATSPSGRLTAAFNWTASRATKAERAAWAFDEEDTVEFVHPVFVLPMHVIEQTERQFRDGGF